MVKSQLFGDWSIWKHAKDYETGKSVVVFEEPRGLFYSLDPIRHGDDVRDLETTKPIVGPFLALHLVASGRDISTLTPSEKLRYAALELLRKYKRNERLPEPDEKIWAYRVY